jgi:hypothetical protein
MMMVGLIMGSPWPTTGGAQATESGFGGRRNSDADDTADTGNLSLSQVGTIYLAAGAYRASGNDCLAARTRPKFVAKRFKNTDRWRVLISKRFWRS